MKRSNDSKKQATSTEVYKRLLTYVLPFWRLFVISTVGFLIYALTQPLFAAMIKHIVDALQSPEREGVEYLPAFIVALVFVRGIGAYLGNYFLARVSTNVIHALRCQIFNHYIYLPTAYFDANNSGYMISRITHNVGEVSRATTDAVRSFIREGLTTIGLFSYLLYTNWLLSLIFIGLAPIIAILVSYVSRRLRRLSKHIQDSIGDMTHITSELVSGHRIVRSFGGEDYERQRFQESSAFNRRQSLKLAATMAVHSPLMQFIISIALAILMYLALMVMKEASAGEFVAYLTAAFMLPRPIRLLSDANADIQKGIAAAESLFEVLDEASEKNEGAYKIEKCLGNLEFKNVSFSYPEANDVAIKNISFKAKAGQTIALVGASGGGKSTLANLIPRFYDYEQGKILLDGVDIKDYTLVNLRQHIALVTQNVTLFNDSIANNIAYGSLVGIQPQQIEQAAEDAYAMQFINAMQSGLETEIGENGVKLSGGQRQRLALARALLKDAPILILDEATSALDTESERYIQEALKKVMKNRTTIVIAHRLSTIENADTILVMEKGQIIESGNHQELIKKKGAYSRLHQLQFSEV